MDKLGDEPTDVERFFEISLFQSKPPEDEPYIGTVGGDMAVNILEGGLLENTVFVLMNTGTTTLRFCIADSAETVCSSGIEVTAGGSETVTAAQLGYRPAWDFFNVTNLDPATEGSYNVVMR